MASTSFRSVCVIGIGLIGGSFASACRRLSDPPRVLGIDVDPVTVAFAVEQGIVDEAALPDSDTAVGWLSSGGCDLVVLAVPARRAVSWLEIIGSHGFDGVVTDVASTKHGVLSAAASLLEAPERFVGGHPMAGSERSGVTAARADLFDGAYWLLTPDSHTDASAYRDVHALVSSLGARVISVDARAHDEAVAIVSHVPHVAAAALVDVAAAHAGEDRELLRLAAGGFKDTTRIAAGSPELWTGICLDNAEAVADGIRELRDSLRAFEVRVRTGDSEGIRTWFASAAEVRGSLPAKWVPSTEALVQLTVPMGDRPGVVAEITGAVSRVGCNIEGIDIDHETEDRALLVLVLTSDGDHPRLLSDLEAAGFEPRVTSLSSTGVEDAS